MKDLKTAIQSIRAAVDVMGAARAYLELRGTLSGEIGARAQPPFRLDGTNCRWKAGTSRIVARELTTPWIEHSMKIRSSTGRYIESENLTTKASGSCLIYR